MGFTPRLRLECLGTVVDEIEEDSEEDPEGFPRGRVAGVRAARERSPGFEGA